MNKLKIALIWGNHYNDKPHTTHHTYWECALRHMPMITFTRYTWHDWQSRMTDEHDLYMFIDFNPSLYKLHNKSFHPRIFYWWDIFHYSFSYPAQIIEMFDKSYFAEYNTVYALQNQGLYNVAWLPPAYYEGLFYPTGAVKDLDFAFIGQPDDVVVRHGLTRKQMIEKLQSYHHNGKQLTSEVRQGVYSTAVNDIYNRSKILIDRTIYNNIGTRVFETIGSGGFALVNRGKVNSGIDKLAIDGYHFVSYDDSFDDLIDKMTYYIDHDRERNRIVDAGHKHFRTNHTYLNRINTILKDFGYEEYGKTA